MIPLSVCIGSIIYNSALAYRDYINALDYESNHCMLEDRFELYCRVERYT